MADLIAEALQVGFLDLMLPARPETCGHDMEVPDSSLYGNDFFPFGTFSSSFPIHAARMVTPGAAISGYKERIVGLVQLRGLMIVTYNPIYIVIYLYLENIL